MLLIFVLGTLMILNKVSGQGCEPYKKYPNHSMCIYKTNKCQPGLTITSSGVLTSKQKDEVINLHNKLRKDIMNGTLKKFAPPAVSMSSMAWDNELAKIAQRSAEQCKMEHDKNRKVDRYPSVGQNIYMKTLSYRKDLENTGPNMTQVIFSWFNEVKEFRFPPENIDPFKFNPDTGHYTQVVWAETKFIGCGFSTFTDKKYIQILTFCNYGPGGNVVGARMYQVKKEKVIPHRRHVVSRKEQ
ncbi:hypothetical protein B566_EDAN007713 [Ephemera danica]|nr:hypothetical protein B566_EDAN007713 [Ephemera danica]